MLRPIRVAAASETPVSVADAKLHLRIDHADDDAVIQALIAAATDHLDGPSGVLGRAIVTQSWRADFKEWPCDGRIWLPVGDVLEVTAVTYLDESNNDQTLAPSEYVGPFVSAHGVWIERANNVNWPSLYDRRDAASVEWEAGFGAAADVPSSLKAAILLIVGFLYENREASPDQAMMSGAVQALVSQYRRNSI